MARSLSDDELRRRFHEHVVTMLSAGDPQPQDQPRLLIVCGQPGAGKSFTERTLIADMDLTSFVAVDADDLRPYHPDYVELARADDRTADEKTVSTSRALATMALNWARGQRFNVVWSTPLSGADVARWAAGRFLPDGYRLDVAGVGVDAARSALSVLHRYQQGRDRSGAGRLVPAGYHDKVYGSLPDTLNTVEAEGLAHGVHLFDRDGQRHYRSERDSTASPAPTAGKALGDVRDRQWTGKAAADFRSVAGWLARSPQTDPAQLPHLRAEHRCSPLAADLRPRLAEVVAMGAARLRGLRAADAVRRAFPTALHRTAARPVTAAPRQPSAQPVRDLPQR
ncbi:zeta toxin family protein [Catellatospora sp. NPDC049133]|uniref:zeta toxin family protein n=1 Tax=Catellatospora sp. NPDC049133 TaxID=3155499 RepID=UPI0033E208D6